MSLTDEHRETQQDEFVRLIREAGRPLSGEEILRSSKRIASKPQLHTIAFSLVHANPPRIVPLGNPKNRTYWLPDLPIPGEPQTEAAAQMRQPAPEVDPLNLRPGQVIEVDDVRSVIVIDPKKNMLNSKTLEAMTMMVDAADEALLLYIAEHGDETTKQLLEAKRQAERALRTYQGKVA